MRIRLTLAQRTAVASTVTVAVLGKYLPDSAAPFAWILLGLVWTWVVFETAPFRRRMARRRRSQAPAGLGVEQTERQNSTSAFRTEDEVLDLYNETTSGVASERSEFVKNEAGSLNPAERAALRAIVVHGEIEVPALQAYVESRGHEWDSSIIARLEQSLVTHNFHGSFLIKPDLKSDIKRFID